MQGVDVDEVGRRSRREGHGAIRPRGGCESRRSSPNRWRGGQAAEGHPRRRRGALRPRPRQRRRDPRHIPAGARSTPRAPSRAWASPSAYLGRAVARPLREHAGGACSTADGVSLDAVVRTDDPTTLALAEVDDDGRRPLPLLRARDLGARPDAEADALAALPEAVAILHVGTLGLDARADGRARWRRWSRRLAGSALVMVDPNIRPWVIADEDAYRARLRRVLAAQPRGQGQRGGRRLAGARPPGADAARRAARRRARGGAADARRRGRAGRDRLRRGGRARAEGRGGRHDRRGRRVRRRVPRLVARAGPRRPRSSPTRPRCRGAAFGCLVAARTCARPAPSRHSCTRSAGRRLLTMRRTPLIAAVLLAVVVAGTASAGPGRAERAAAATPPTAARPTAARPTIVQRPIPFGAAPRRRARLRAAPLRHRRLPPAHPKVIVEHYTVTPTFQATFNTFANDVPDVELHELPGTCAHFIVDRDGTIYQLVPLTIMCRHTVGLNWTRDRDRARRAQRRARSSTAPRRSRASLRLTRWLRCRYGIAARNVIGHNESLSSPYHHENVAALRAPDARRLDARRDDARPRPGRALPVRPLGRGEGGQVGLEDARRVGVVDLRAVDGEARAHGREVHRPALDRAELAVGSRNGHAHDADR